ncbi:DUF6499 domain-containing protein [Limnohabitans sp.]|uniref:transcriptional regulator domain-containing protein n=1 Tax=Limnohabitans sp. TaxID=1907725 RepID=UPI003341B20C
MKPYKADWRKAEQYPPLGCDDAQRLAWEFLRRNRHYAAHVAQMEALAEDEFQGGLKKGSLSKLIGLECWPPAEHDETAADYYARTSTKSKGSKGKRGRIDKPCNTFVNKWSLTAPIPVTTDYDASVIRFVPHKVALKRHSDLQTKNFNLFLYPNEVAIRFRLDMRLKPQLESARRRLDAAAADFDAALEKLAQPTSKDAPPFVSLRATREREVMRLAHYWLRSYDALTSGQVLLGDEKRRRAFESGEAEIRTFFTREITTAHGEQKKSFERGLVVGWHDAADSYINGMKFLTLLNGFEPKDLAEHSQLSILDHLMFAMSGGKKTS